MSNGIEHFKGDDGQYYFRVKAANGKTVAVSEGYKGERNARRGADALIRTIVGEATTEENIEAFAIAYGEELHPSQPTSSYLTIAKDRRVLHRLMSLAARDGWTITPPAPKEEQTP